jgi:hypothetical protein
MFKGPTKFGFAAPAHDNARHDSPLPALIATLSLGLSIAVVVTAITVNAARAAHFF